MLADCHMHMVLDGVHWKSAISRHTGKPDLGFIRSTLAHYQKCGFTYLRDGGDRWGVGAAARALAADYGITYRTPLSPLCMEGHYGSFIGTVYRDLHEYAQLVARLKNDGGDFIKLMVSGLMDFDRFGVLTEEGLPDKTIYELIRIAKDAGMAVMVHANGARVIEACARAGADSVEHGAYADKSALCAMRENETVWVPTLSTIGNLRGKGRFDEYNVQKIFELAMQNVQAFHAMGGILAPGSDAGAWEVLHGTQSEFALLSEAGVSRSAVQNGISAVKARF